MIRKTFKLLLFLVITLLSIVFLYYSYLYLKFDSNSLPVNHGKVHTKLYLGEGKNQLLIVGLGGSEGGNVWTSDYWKDQREKFLSEGFSFLAIGYFGMQGLPKELDRISIDGVYHAIQESAKHQKINKNCILLIGGSKGAELSLFLASKYQNIKAVIAIVPSHAVFAGITELMSTSSFTFNNQQIPFVPVTWSVLPTLLKGDYRSAYEELIRDKSKIEKALIEVEKINGPILFVSALRDEMWPSTEMSNEMMVRLKSMSFKHHYEHIVIEGDHASPLKNFDKLEPFLSKHFLDSQTDCFREQPSKES